MERGVNAVLLPQEASVLVASFHILSIVQALLYYTVRL